MPWPSLHKHHQIPPRFHSHFACSLRFPSPPNFSPHLSSFLSSPLPQSGLPYISSSCSYTRTVAMPVLSEPYAHAAMGAPYLLLAFALLGICFIVMRRRRSTSTASLAQAPTYSEKDTEITQFRDEKDIQEKKETSTAIEQSTTRIQRPPQPPPFTPPMPLVATQDLNFGMGMNASYYDSPTSDSPIISTFDSFETAGMDVPRRRSYTKTTAGGVEVQGEVVMAEGWRRHTRVFGGGVCIACEESERRMTA